ncbi:MAG: virulence RhuM family protein [Bacteroidales bacterium]|jgi:hypothetical protein|nr:virulence RhuM family protein [Bacteroidales bacterium]
MENFGEIILYRPDETVKIEVRLENETVWLTQAQIAELFGTKRPAITKHLGNIFSSGELNEREVCSILELTTPHGAIDGKTQTQQVKIYNLDAILSVGYRVNSLNATNFRRWSNSILKDYLLKGYSINQRLNQLENNVNAKFIRQQQQIGELKDKVDFFVRTSLPPVEGVFFDGQIFDAYVFAANLIKSAKKTIVLIDNYVDESVLIMLSKRTSGVKATIYTGTVTTQFNLDLSKYNSQYPKVDIKQYKHSHDRFIIIDDEVYHIGASLKDLGKKLFAFSKMNIPAQIILKQLQ